MARIAKQETQGLDNTYTHKKCVASCVGHLQMGFTEKDNVCVCVTATGPHLMLFSTYLSKYRMCVYVCASCEVEDALRAYGMCQDDHKI